MFCCCPLRLHKSGCVPSIGVVEEMNVVARNGAVEEMNVCPA